jgi:hypothetical protein
MTRVYDRRQKKVAGSAVGRISMWLSCRTWLGQEHHHGEYCLLLL